MTKRSYRTLSVVGLAFGLAVAIACTMLILRGAQGDGVDTGLFLTARLAFVFFWPCYVAGALVSLFGPVFLPLRRNARDLGLAFAAVEVVHLSLVARLCWIGEAPSRSTFILFGSAAIFVAVIALLSFDFARRHVSERVIRGIRWVGMNFIIYAFAVDFLHSPLSGGAKHVIEYLPFTTLSLAGPVLRLLAWVKTIDKILRHSPYVTGIGARRAP
jgi:hypothetical protein